jgi:hypothetical protein
VWKAEKGAAAFTNDFLYDPKTDSWQWSMDNIVNGIHKQFGRVKLTRVKPLHRRPAYISHRVR